MPVVQAQSSFTYCGLSQLPSPILNTEITKEIHMLRSHHINKNITCGSLQDNLPLRLRYLRTWFSCSHADWISLESMGFPESVYNWERTLRLKSPTLFPVKILLPAQSWRCKVSLFLMPYLLSASTVPYHVGPLSPWTPKPK